MVVRFEHAFRRLSVRALCVSLAVLLAPRVADGHVVRIVIDHRETVSARGPAAEKAPQYERLVGRFYGELDPADPHNAIINDIRLAPRNARGKVEYWASFTLLRPVEAARASGVLWYEVPNRGRSPLDVAPNADSMIAGDLLLSSGWQGDLEPRAGVETVSVPTARNADGSAITGPVLIRLSNLPAGASTAPLTAGYGGLRYQRPATLETSGALLTKQYSDDGALTPISPDEWAFAKCQGSQFPGQPDSASICLKAGFEPDALYQLVYTAKDPLVLGIGLAATRDLLSFLRYEKTDAGGAVNPAAGAVRFALAEGTSQSGNFLKTFVHLGFNQDEADRIVWDGINPNIAARQTPLNFRFAIPGGAADLYEPGSEGALWWGDYRDETRGRGASALLERCRTSRTCPKVVETFGSAEFWGLRMSPGLVGTAASSDIPLPPDVRRYYFPGVTHGGGAGGFELGTRPSAGCSLPQNPNPSADTLRALRRALADWVVNGLPPPPSRYPTLAAGDLVRPEHTAIGFPIIPGQPLPDNVINPFPDYDFGPAFRYGDLSGAITLQPPVIRRLIPMLVPRTDADGNEVAGVASVLHSAPLGTYLGWNITAGGYRKGRGCGFTGGYIAFAKTRAEREAARDPRPSLEERYGTHDGYVARVRQAARRLVEERFLLQEDADRLVRQADASAVLR